MAAELYNGKPCKRCGATERYTSNYSCVTCSIKRQAKKRAESQPGERYNGKPCVRCGSTERYKSTGSCVACVNERRAKRQAKRRAEYGTKTYNGTPCKRCGATERSTSAGYCLKCSVGSVGRARHIKYKYGLTPEQALQMWEDQGRSCSLCRKPISDPMTGGLKCHIDHCHKTGKVRGLTCSRCNTVVLPVVDRLCRDSVFADAIVEYTTFRMRARYASGET